MPPGNMNLDDKGYLMSLAMKAALYSCYSRVNQCLTPFSPHRIARAVILGGTWQTEVMCLRSEQMSVAVEELNAELPNFFLSFLLAGFPIPLELPSISDTMYYVSSNTLMIVYSSKV